MPSHHRGRHADARDGNRADEIERIEFRPLRQRRALDLHQHVDRHAFRMLRQRGQSRDHADAISEIFTHANDTAATHIDPGRAHMVERVEAILIGARGDDLAVKLRRCIEIVVVVIEAGLFQPRRLLAVEHAERGAGLQTHCLDAFDHGADVFDVAILRRTPGRAHAETRRAAGFRRRGFLEHGVEGHQLLGLDAGVVARRLRAIGAVFRAAAGLDRQQGGDLDLGWIEIPTVHGRRLVHQVGERQLEQSAHFDAGPVMAGYCGA